jgi:hypothetical protein
MTEPDLQVGDVITLGKGGRGVPDELADDKYFRVEASVDNGWTLSRPYVDKACTIPYRADPAKAFPRAGSADE